MSSDYVFQALIQPGEHLDLIVLRDASAGTNHPFDFGVDEIFCPCSDRPVSPLLIPATELHQHLPHT